jgi:hypothetical protein
LIIPKKKKKKKKNRMLLEEVDVGHESSVLPSAITTSISGRRSPNIRVISSANQSTTAAASTSNKK